MAQDELLRIYTPQGEATETFKPRWQVHRDGDWHATVHLWILNSAAQLLFQKRATTTEMNPGLWDVSAAGHVVGADSRELSLEREALEELGVTLCAQQAKWLFTLKTEAHFATASERVFQHIHLIKLDIELAGLKPQAEEVAATAWRPYSLLRTLLTDCSGFVPRTEEYQRLLNYLENDI